MKPKNAQFKPFADYAVTPPNTLHGIMDFARALEDTAHHVMPTWHVVALDNPHQPPTAEQAANAPTIQIGESGNPIQAWVCARMEHPAIAALAPAAEWGRWEIQFDSDGLGDVYADGKLVQSRLFLHGTAQAGTAHADTEPPWVAYSLDTTIQNVALEMARCRLGGLHELNTNVRDMARSLRTAASLLLPENPRVNRFISGEVQINRSDLSDGERIALEQSLVDAAGCIDIKALLAKDRVAFERSLEACREALAPLAVFAKRFHLFLLGVSHMDLAWKWRWPETIECMRGTLSNQVGFMKDRPDYTFLESSPPVWHALRERDPELYQDLKAAGRRGQFEPAGGMWVEPDGQMLGDESWVRQVLHGQRAAKDVCGCESRAGHNTDAFGFSWALPKIYAGSGMEAFLTQKMRYNEFTVFEEVLFWWESDDGSRILGVHTYPDHYQEIDGDEMAEAVRIFNRTSGVYSAALLFGIGNHGGGPLPDMFDRIDELRHQTVYPTVHLSGMHGYLDHLHAHEQATLDRLPVIRDELFLECHHKTYTVQARVKAANRRAERELYHAEAAAAASRTDTSTLCQSAWETVLFNQFHDILPGTSFPMVYQDVFEDYDRAFANIDQARKTAWAGMAPPGDTAIHIFNTLPWRRAGAISFDLPGAAAQGVIEDDTGQLSAYQRTGDGDTVVAVLPELPALGLRSLTIGDGAVQTDTPWKSDANWVENQFFRAEFDPATGAICSLQLADGTELAHGRGIGCLDMLEDAPEGFYQTWNMNLTGREDPAVCNRFECIETGPVRLRFRAHLSFGLWEKKKQFMVPIMWNTPGVEHPTSFFTIDYTIYRDLPVIECVMQADWWEDDTDLKVAAYTPLTNTHAHYGIPFGSIERPTKRETPYEKARYEVPANRWADITDTTSGVAILNTGRHGHDALDGRIRLTLLTSPYGGEKVHVPDPLADRGKHEIRYAFYPHHGTHTDGNVARTAMEYEYEPQVLRTGPANLDVGHDLLRVDADHVLVSTVKPAEDGDGIILRCYESKGAEAPLNISGDLWCAESRAVDLMEHDKGPAPKAIQPHQIVSLRIPRKP